MVQGWEEASGDSYFDFAGYIGLASEKWIASEQSGSFCDLNELMVTERFINVADK